MGVRRRSVTGWVLYDLANTVFSLNITSLYFPLWVTNVMGRSDSTYAVASSVSMAIIFVLSPVLGALTDQSPRRMPFLVVSTLICVTMTALLGRFGLIASLVLFVVANVSYQAGLQFYDAMLPDVSTPANRGRIGGIGVAVGYLGSFLGIMLGRWILTGVDDLPLMLRTDRYVTVFTMSAALFFIFALPCFFLVRERRRTDRRFDSQAVTRAVKQVMETIRDLRQRPALARFLVGRVFYTDAVNTVIAFMGIYVTNAVGFTTGQTQLVLLIAIVGAVIGGFVWGRVVDRLGPKRTLDIVLWLWVMVFGWAALVGFLRWPPASFWPVPALAGIALGGTWSADRPLMLLLTPRDRIGEFYGLYGMAGRFSAILGPLLWGFVSEGLGLGRPAAVASLLVFILVAMVILRPLSNRSEVDELDHERSTS